MGRNARLITLFTFLPIAIACSTPAPKSAPPALDASKFEPAYHAAKEIQSALAVGVNYSSFAPLVRELATQVSIAGDKASTTNELELLQTYWELVDRYKDSFSIWSTAVEQHTGPNSFNANPSDRDLIVVEGTSIVDLVPKYSFKTQPWGTFSSKTYIGRVHGAIPLTLLASADARQIIWAQADSITSKIVALTQNGSHPTG
jgi:hypothetical protein